MVDKNENQCVTYFSIIFSNRLTYSFGSSSIKALSKIMWAVKTNFIHAKKQFSVVKR